MPQAPGPTRRWGVRTLAFLTVAAGSVIASNVLAANGNTDYVLLTLLGTLGGFVGAGVCTARGLRAWRGAPPP